MKIQWDGPKSALSDELFERAKEFGLILQMDPSDYRLVPDESERLTLFDPQGRKLKIEFDGGSPDYHRRGTRGKQEILAKALGSKQKLTRVLDLTAGLGQDAVFLCQLGFQVTSIERNPLLVFLLKEAQRRTQRSELSSWEIFWGDAKNFLTQEDFMKPFEAVYFDPMYPTKKKSALPRQEMLLFKDLVGSDEDASEIAQVLWERVRGRIVVKRPLEAEPLLKPTHSYVGKTVRYDVTVR